jgi:GTP-binding protein
LQTLADFEHRHRYMAANGEHGQGNDKNGRSGGDITLDVPCGTLVFDDETGEGLADLVEPGDIYVAAMGGSGGRGNRVFASSRRRAPRFSEKGSLGGQAGLRLELKLIADIGLIGLPNAGKSSILAAVSGAAPKIADYPFTTLSPNLGVLRTDFDAIVLADIPGLIEGAHEDKGLGAAFLRHIERTRMLVHVLDMAPDHGVRWDAEDVTRDWAVVREEMRSYDPELEKRPCIVVGNKLDILGEYGAPPDYISSVERFIRERGFDFRAVSARSGEKMDELARTIADFAERTPRPKGNVRLFAPLPTETALTEKERRSGRRADIVQVVALPGGNFRVLNERLERAAERYDLSQPENAARFSRLLRKHRVEELLSAAGAAEGASVSIGAACFDFHPDDD